jgi:F-type H+-transporting ATPase subunit c
MACLLQKVAAVLYVNKMEICLSHGGVLCYGAVKDKLMTVKGDLKMVRRFGKSFLTFISAVAAVLVSSPVVFAAEALPGAGESYVKVLFAVGAMIAAGFAMGVGAVGAGIGIGNAASGACQAVGRNPGVQGKIMTVMMVGMAMAESVAIYALVVSLVLLYANPYVKYFLG